jgi:TRAP-type C4-dicarboxylate transport system permease small subunit
MQDRDKESMKDENKGATGVRATLGIIGRVVISLLIGVMSLVIIVNVLSRYLLNYSLTWAAETAEYCMVWAAFISMAVLVFRQEHLAVDLLLRALQGLSKKVLKIFILLGSLCFFVPMTYFGIQLVIATRGQVASSLRFLPMNLVYSVIPFAGIIMVVGTLILIGQEFRHKKQDAQ